MLSVPATTAAIANTPIGVSATMKLVAFDTAPAGDGEHLEQRAPCRARR